MDHNLKNALHNNSHVPAMFLSILALYVSTLIRIYCEAEFFTRGIMNSGIIAKILIRNELELLPSRLLLENSTGTQGGRRSIFTATVVCWTHFFFLNLLYRRILYGTLLSVALNLCAYLYRDKGLGRSFVLDLTRPTAPEFFNLFSPIYESARAGFAKLGAGRSWLTFKRSWLGRQTPRWPAIFCGNADSKDFGYYFSWWERAVRAVMVRLLPVPSLYNDKSSLVSSCLCFDVGVSRLFLYEAYGVGKSSLNSLIH